MNNLSHKHLGTNYQRKKCILTYIILYYIVYIYSRPPLDTIDAYDDIRCKN